MFIQFVKFGLIGFMNTFINYGIFALCYYLFSLRFEGDILKTLAIVSNLMAFCVTVFIAYVLQVKYVFDGGGQSKGRMLVKSYTVYGFSNGVMENVILGVCINFFGIIPYLAKFVPMFITIPTNFLLHKYWVYKEGSKKEIENE